MRFKINMADRNKQAIEKAKAKTRHTIELTGEEKNLIYQLLNEVTFKGQFAEKIVALKGKFK